MLREDSVLYPYTTMTMFFIQRKMIQRSEHSIQGIEMDISIIQMKLEINRMYVHDRTTPLTPNQTTIVFDRFAANRNESYIREKQRAKHRFRSTRAGATK